MYKSKSRLYRKGEWRKSQTKDEQWVGKKKGIPGSLSICNSDSSQVETHHLPDQHEIGLRKLQDASTVRAVGRSPAPRGESLLRLPLWIGHPKSSGEGRRRGQNRALCSAVDG